MYVSKPAVCQSCPLVSVSRSALLSLRESESMCNCSDVLGSLYTNTQLYKFPYLTLFFRILFTLEPLDNVGDFENFLDYLKITYTESKYINKQKDILISRFGENFKVIDEAVIAKVAETLVLIDKIDIVYDYNIEDVNEIIEYIYKYINDNINTFESWKPAKDSILLHLQNEIMEVLE